MDQTDVGLQTVVKALTDTVAGAIDPQDHLAREQLRLAAGYVDFVRKRLHLIHARERYDLKHNAALARTLLRLDDSESAEGAAMRGLLGDAEALTADPAALTGDLRRASMELAHAVSGFVQAAHAHGHAQVRAIDRAVIEASEERLRVERLWYEPIGFEPAPLSGPTLEESLK